jgi:hypothetical protein
MSSVPSSMPCSKCGVEYPLTSEFFIPAKANRYGLTRQCRKCINQREKERYWDNPDLARSKARNKYKNNPEPPKQRRKDYYKTPHGKAVHNAWNKEWRKNNPDKVKESKKRDYEKHKDKRKATMRRSYPKNKAAIMARGKEWKKAHPEVVNINTHKRLARKKGLPFQFNNKDWERCLDYWDNRCAICGREISETHLLAKDHWIPMFDKRPDNPGTVPTNIIPVCHGRKQAKCSGCNENKWKFDPEKWIRSQYPPDEADAIIKRIHDYFEWVKTRS